jgi:hypothetical protein
VKIDERNLLLDDQGIPIIDIIRQELIGIIAPKKKIWLSIFQNEKKDRDNE